jgi:hypothetical protein
MFDLFGKKRRQQQEQAQLAALRAAIAEPAYSKDPSKWIAVPPPLPGSPQWYAANNAYCAWGVSLQNGRAHVEWIDPKLSNPNAPAFLKPTTSSLCARRVEDGWLVGSDSGEWGGSLSWYSADGGESYGVPNGGQVRFFLETSRGLLAFAGLDHLGTSEGKALLVKRANATQRWSAELFANLPEAPYAAVSDTERSFLLVTSSQLLHIALEGQTKVLMQNAFWDGLYPNSAVMDAAGLYIGMRHGVARIVGDDQKIVTQWLLPNQSFVNAQPLY